MLIKFFAQKKQIVKCYYSLKQLYFLQYLQFYILVSHDPSEIILICIFILLLIFERKTQQSCG